MNLWHFLTGLYHQVLSLEQSGGMARWAVWTGFMALLSFALPLVIGIGMRLVSFRPDKDARPRKTRQQIISDRARTRAQFAGVQFRRADVVHELELPSPEPAPFTAPE